MIDKLVAVFDVKLKLFMSPFLARNIAAGLRQFSDMCNAPNSQLGKHPEDFVLYELGTFDIENGILSPATPIHVIGKALDFVNAGEPVQTATH